MRPNRKNEIGTLNTKKERGFSLIEVMVAIAILTFGLLAVAKMQMSSIQANSFAGGTTEATTWAVDQLENLVYLDWDDANIQDTDGDGLAGLNDTGFDNNPATQNDSDFQQAQGIYSIHWNVADNAVINNTKTISVIVIWADHGFEKSVALQRVIPRII